MTILGIDPGIGRLGWGVLEVQSAKCKVQSFGCIETSSKTPTEQRLLQIYKELSSIIDKQKPEVLVLEDLFFGDNAKTAFAVGQARGVILLLAGEHKLKTAAYTPLQVKVAITGYGRADKAQISKMVKVLLKLKTMPKLDDTVDALAIALTHAFSNKMAVL